LNPSAAQTQLSERININPSCVFTAKRLDSEAQGRASRTLGFGVQPLRGKDNGANTQHFRWLRLCSA